MFGDSPTIDEAGSETAATDGSVTNDAASVEAGGRPRMVDIGMGAFHGCALGEDGSVWCWGSNGGGQLGDGSVGGGRLTAKRVGGLPTIAQLSVGLAHTCAVGNDHTI